MDPNNMTAGMPGGQNNTVPGVAPGAMNPNGMAAEMQTANPVESPKENIMAGGASVKKKGGKGMMLAVVFLALVAAGGIGFGVWAMMDGDSQVESLNKQISSLRSQNSELLDKLAEQGEGTVVENDVVVDTDTTTKVNPEDYIYVGKWGIKIKKPENWGDSVVFNGYEYNHNTQTSDTLLIELYIVGKAEQGILQINYPISASCSDFYANCMEYNGDFYSIETYTLKDGHTYQENDIPESLVKYFLTPENYSAI